MTCMVKEMREIFNGDTLPKFFLSKGYWKGKMDFKGGNTEQRLQFAAEVVALLWQ
jgi:hypothetical protein